MTLSVGRLPLATAPVQSYILVESELQQQPDSSE